MAASYAHLERLLSGYLHQDYMEVSGSVDGAIDDFLKLESPAAAAGLRADLRRFLGRHGDAPLAAFARTFPYSFVIGENDAEARAWLEAALARAA